MGLREIAIARTMTQLKQNYASQGRMLTENRSRLTALEEKYAVASSALAKAKEAAAGGGPGDAKKSETVSLNMRDLIRDHPEMEEIFRKQVRRGILQQYGNILDSLNLPPDQKAKLKDLLVEQTVSPIEAARAAADLGVAPDSPKMQKARSQARREVQKEIDALVGPEVAGMFNGNSAYLLQNGLNDLSDAGQPLSSDQVMAMMRITGDVADPQKNPGLRQPGSFDPDPETGLSPAEQGVLQRAAGDRFRPSNWRSSRRIGCSNTSSRLIMRQATGDAKSWSIRWQ